MKKFLNLTLAAAIAFGFAACQKTNNGQEPDNVEGNAYVTLSFSEAKTTTRVTDGQQDHVGTVAESKVNEAHFLGGGTSVLFDQFTENPTGTFTANAAKQYTGDTGSSVRTALVVNAPTSYAPVLLATATFSVDNLASLVDDANGFVMTSTSNETQNIQEGTEAEVNAGSKNNFSYDVERVVSKVQVTQPNAGIVVEVNGYTGAKITGERFALAGSADKVTLFADNAGGRTLEVPTAGGVPVYKDFQSAIHSVPAGGGTAARANVTKVSDAKLVGKGTGWDAGKQSAPINKLQDFKVSTDLGIYFLENSIDVTADNVRKLDYKDIAHVKVYAQFLPGAGQVYKFDAASSKVVPTVADDFLTSGLLKAVAEDTGKHGDLVGVVNKPGTFYKGMTTGRLYNSLTAARADGNLKSEKFDEGRMVFRTPANRQKAETDDPYPSYLDTRRNNIYALNITKITGIGENYDINDPTDPNIPKPDDNPDEPDKDPKTPVYETDKFIKVKAVVLPWNLVNRDVVLSN